VRQKATCADMIFSVTELVSFWSRVGLAPGDLIATGTPEGVARHRKPDPFEYYLKPGDVVEAKIDQIGTLTTSIV
jgi:2-keto-4-pentenoate hydratase/2-oxohepta-3-ene-1,7-dioic acid hydratase in catechol pathway